MKDTLSTRDFPEPFRLSVGAGTLGSSRDVFETSDLGPAQRRDHFFLSIGGKPMRHREPTIRCPIFIFEEQEKEILRFTKLVNITKDVAEKEHYAQMMLEELGVLLSCQAYNGKDESCIACRKVSSLRKEGGEVALKGIQLARKLKG